MRSLNFTSDTLNWFKFICSVPLLYITNIWCKASRIRDPSFYYRKLFPPKHHRFQQLIRSMCWWNMNLSTCLLLDITQKRNCRHEADILPFWGSLFQTELLWLVLCMLSCFSRVWPSAALWTPACQAHLSMEFFRQPTPVFWPFPALGDLPNPGIEPVSLHLPALADGFFTTSATWEDFSYTFLLKDFFFIRIEEVVYTVINYFENL